jgi:hypothetical protein
VEALDGGLQVSVSGITSTSCGVDTGRFTLTVLAGTALYQYQIVGHVVQTMVGNSGVLNNLSAGRHIWRVTDVTGCFAQDTIIISNSGTNTLAFTATPTDIQCDGTLGSIALSVTSGIAPYQYSRDNGTTWVSFVGNSTTATIPNLTVGVYNITVRDNSGCTFGYQSVPVNQRTIIAPPSATTVQEFCVGATVADLRATGSGIKWYDGSGTLLLPTTPLLNNTLYYATQTSGINCESSTKTHVCSQHRNASTFMFACYFGRYCRKR